MNTVKYKRIKTAVESCSPSKTVVKCWELGCRRDHGDHPSEPRTTEEFWRWETSAGLDLNCHGYSLICIYPLWPFGDFGTPGVGEKYSPNQVRKVSFVFRS